jgi:KTSC domain
VRRKGTTRAFLEVVGWDIFAGSSHLAQARFDPAAGTLEITFQDGRTYSYGDETKPVPVSVYAGLCNARSAGRYFNEFVLGAYGPGEEV